MPADACCRTNPPRRIKRLRPSRKSVRNTGERKTTMPWHTHSFLAMRATRSRWPAWGKFLCATLTRTARWTFYCTRPRSRPARARSDATLWAALVSANLICIHSLTPRPPGYSHTFFAQGMTASRCTASATRITTTRPTWASTATATAGRTTTRWWHPNHRPRRPSHHRRPLIRRPHRPCNRPECHRPRRPFRESNGQFQPQ